MALISDPAPDPATMTDYHCHLLPALDDGPQTADDAIDMARALAAFGFRDVCCTPHCIPGHYEISPVEVREAVDKLQARLDIEGIALTLHPGMEYYLDKHFERFAANLLPLGESRVVLCEAPPQAPPALVAEMAGLIVVQGFIPLVAHPERTDVIWAMLERSQSTAENGREASPAPAGGEPESGTGTTPPAAAPWWRRLFGRATARSPVGPRPFAPPPPPCAGFAELPEEVLFQANLGSFSGFYGDRIQRRAYELLQRGVYHCFSSDLHDHRSVTAVLEPAREKLAYNPALQKLAAFVAPQGTGGSPQLAFW